MTKQDREMLRKVLTYYGSGDVKHWTGSEGAEIGKLIALGFIREEAFSIASGYTQADEYMQNPDQYPLTNEGTELLDKAMVERLGERKWFRNVRNIIIAITAVSTAVVAVYGIVKIAKLIWPDSD